MVTEPKSNEFDVDCPHCGRVREVHTGAGDAQGTTPSSGDVSICFNCLGTSVFDDTLKLRLPTQQEAKEIAAIPSFTELMFQLISLKTKQMDERK